MKTTPFRKRQPVLLVYSVCLLSLLEGPKVMAGTYTTDFPLTNNPISEGGNWINGKTTGLDWSDVQTTNGMAIGTQVGTEYATNNYNDSTALLTGTWGPNQTASATVYATNQRNDVYEEVEIRLRSSLSAHSCTGYEINFSLKADPSQTYCQIVRWLGPNGIKGIGFEYLAGENYQGQGLPFTLHTGDVVTATITNSTITAYINGIQYLQATDPNAYSSGSPGMGFYIGGTTGVDGDYGFTSYTVTDGSPGYLTTTTLTSSQNPSLPGQSVTFTGTVQTNGVTAGAATGTVQFKTNGVAFGSAVAVSSGSVSANISTLPHGSNAITAEYSGDMNFLTSTGSVSQTVDTPPIGGTHFLGATLNTTLSVSSSVLANLDYDADGDTLTITKVCSTSTNGPPGNVTLSGGMVNYTPKTDYVGMDQFTYTISDGYPGGSATSTATVTVRLGNATSVFNSTSTAVNGVSLRGYGIPENQYDIQRSCDPSFPSYSTLATIIAAANGIIFYTDTNAPSPSFYRFAVHNPSGS
jgi:hypothetical protein